MQKRFGAFSSSVNPEVLGRKWQGIFIAISTFFGAVGTFLTLPVIGTIFGMLGLGDNLGQLAAAVTTIGITIGTLGGATVTAYGAIYHIFIKVWDNYLSKISFLN